MSATLDLLAVDFLGPSAAQVVESILDEAQRTRVVRSIHIAAQALRVVDAFDLSPHEAGLEASRDKEIADLSVWNQVAPQVRSLLLEVRSAAEELRLLWPESEHDDEPSLDLDLAFEQLSTGITPVPIRDQREAELDQIVGGATESQAEVASAIASLAGMLQEDFVAFGARLRNPRVVADRWFLLGELTELKMKCTQCLEAIVATVLSAFSRSDPSELIPRYLNAARRAVRLRTAVVELSEDIDQLNERLQQTKESDAAELIRRAMANRLGRFTQSSAYALVRPGDKRELIVFRLRLSALADPGTSVRAIQQLCEGLAKFLEVMRSINQREVLERHDRGKLQTIRMLLEADAELTDILPALEDVVGRSEVLDAQIRRLRRGELISNDRLLEAVIQAQGPLAP